MAKSPSEEYLEKAKLLTEEERERLLSRMRAKLVRRLEDKDLSELEHVAIQLEIEDRKLKEWRERVADLRNGEAGKNLRPAQGSTERVVEPK